MLGVGLLGPVTAWSNDATLPITRPLERALLARLALAQGEGVDAFRLLDDLWISPESGGMAALHTQIYRLRRSLGAEGARLVRSGGAYSLKLDPERVDVSRFQQLAARGRASLQAGDVNQAADIFHAALALWRGPALADVGDVPFAPAQRAILHELRWSVFEQWVDATLECGRHREVVAQLEGVLVEEPLRERLWEMLILALYRSGRQADALAAYHRLRHLLAEELGVDPSPPLVALHQAVLQQSPTLASVAISPAGDTPRSRLVLPLPSQIAVERPRDFVGRTAELQQAERLIAAPDRDRLAALWILGEPGVGKTRLAAEIAVRVHDLGGLVLFGRCNEDVAVPYQPFLEALQWYVARIPAAELAGRLGAAPAELGRLVPEISVRLPDAKIPPATDSELEHHRLFEAVRTWLADASDGKPFVFVLDDVHWASRPTLALLGHVARSAEASRVTLVCTARTTSPDENEALAGLMEELGRRGVPSERMELAGLSFEAVAQLVQAVSERPMDDRLAADVRRIYEDTGGNPLLLDSLLSTVVGQADAGTTDAGGTLRMTVDRRMARQPAGVAELLSTAAVAGVEFELSVVARAAGRAEAETLRGLEAAQQAGLVEEEAVNRYRFRHALVRDVLSARLSRSRRARMHLSVGEALETVHSDSLEEHASALAFHFGEAEAVGGAAKALRYTLLEGERATRLLSHQEAVDAYTRALTLLDPSGQMGVSRGAVLLELGQAKRRSGDVLAALETFWSAAEEAAAEGATEHLAKAAVAYEETSYWVGHRGDEASLLLEQAVKRLGESDPALKALTLAAYSRALDSSSGGSDGTEPAKEALALAEAVRDARTRFAVAFRTTRSSLRVELAPQAAKQWIELYQTAEEIGDPDAYLFALGEAMWAVAMNGDIASWDDLFARYSLLAVQLREPRWASWLEGFRAFRAFLAADLEGAELHIERLRRTSEGFGWGAEGLYGVGMFLIRREQGRLSELLPALQAAAQLDLDGLWRPGLAALYAELDRLDDARRVFEEVLSDGLAGIAADGTWDLSVGLLAEVCVALQDEAHAPLLLELLRPCEGRLLAFLGCAGNLGPVDRLLGMLACLAGRSEDGKEWHRRGVEFARTLQSPLWTAHCLWGFASHIGAADELAGRRMISEATAICAKHDLIGLRQRIEGSGH